MPDSVNLHISYDFNGFFTNKTADFLNTIHPGRNIFLNTFDGCINQRTDVNYNTVNGFLKSNVGLPVKAVIFHSYNYFNKEAIKRIKASYPNQAIKFVWIFWSHEYYQLPEFLPGLFRGLSHRFYFRKLLSFHTNLLRLFLKGRTEAPFYTGIGSFKKTFKEFDLFCAFLQGDHDTVMKDFKQVPFAFSSYLTLNEFPAVDNDFNNNKTDIMVGHSGTPILNHYEVLKSLSDMNVPNPILMPFSYGKGRYMKLLERKLEQLKNINVTIQTEFLTKDEYYRKIGNVGYFILNCYCQQALGNIVFFLWTGTKLFVRKDTSTYKTFKEQGFYVFSIEDDLNPAGLVPLTPDQKKHNHGLMAALLSEEHVKNSWLRILNI